MELLFFGSLKEITQAEKLLISAIVDTAVGAVVDTDELKNLLNKKYPALQKAKYFMAVNQQMIHQNTALKQDDIVALMPPFSGG